MNVTVKFPVSKSRSLGETEFCATVGDMTICAKTKADLEQRVNHFVQQCVSSSPAVAMVRSPDGDVRILLERLEGVATYRPCDKNDVGVVMLTTTAQSYGRDILDEARFAAMHFAQQSWSEGDPIPEWLPEDKREEFAAWTRFVTAYRIASAAGCSDTQSHQLACEAMRV